MGEVVLGAKLEFRVHAVLPAVNHHRHARVLHSAASALPVEPMRRQAEVNVLFCRTIST